MRGMSFIEKIATHRAENDGGQIGQHTPSLHQLVGQLIGIKTTLHSGSSIRQ
jgi:hypothetical protein